MPTTIEEDVVNCTSEKQLSEDWAQIIDLCEKVQIKGSDARIAVNALSKRIVHPNANVVLYAITLASALVKNCGPELHREISSRNFVHALKGRLDDQLTHTLVKQQIWSLMKEWNKEFEGNPDMEYVTDMYKQMVREGTYDFGEANGDQGKSKTSDQKALQQKEEDEMALAIALSLSESEQHKKKHSENKRQKRVEQAPTRQSSVQQPSGKDHAKPLYVVKALFDFKKETDDELSFKMGEIMDVLQEIHQDWWRAKSKATGNIGLVPRNYVKRLNSDQVPPGGFAPKSSQPQDPSKLDEAGEEAFINAETQRVEELIRMLESHQIQSGSLAAGQEMPGLKLYNDLILKRPQVLHLLEKYTRKKEQLQALNDTFLKARSSFDRMIEASIKNSGVQPPGQMPTGPASYHQGPPPGPSGAPSLYPRPPGPTGYPAPGHPQHGPPQPPGPPRYPVQDPWMGVHAGYAPSYPTPPPSDPSGAAYSQSPSQTESSIQQSQQRPPMPMPGGQPYPQPMYAPPPDQAASQSAYSMPPPGPSPAVLPQAAASSFSDPNSSSMYEASSSSYGQANTSTSAPGPPVTNQANTSTSAPGPPVTNQAPLGPPSGGATASFYQAAPSQGPPQGYPPTGPYGYANWPQPATQPYQGMPPLLPQQDSSNGVPR